VEEVCGEAQRTPRATTALGDSLFSEMEMREAQKRQSASISGSAQTSEQAEAINGGNAFVMQMRNAPLGVIFPGSGAFTAAGRELRWSGLKIAA